MDRSLLILSPLEIEARAIAAQLDGRARVEIIGLRAARLGKILAHQTVILAGLAGAIDPSVSCGDVVLDEASSLDTGGLTFRVGRIVTAEGIVSTAQQKADLFRETGGLAVDMEGVIVRDAAERAGASFVHVRAISDAADEAIDPALLGLVDEMGKTKRSSVASLLIRRPGKLMELMRLGSRSGLALRNLASAVRIITDRISI
jgi:nucleoside phosphorylase